LRVGWRPRSFFMDADHPTTQTARCQTLHADVVSVPYLVNPKTIWHGSRRFT
jgi:hypothetical protein